MKRSLAYFWRFLKLPKNVQLFVMRFFNDSFLVGVMGVIINDKNEILLLKHTYRQTAWALPSGYLKKGEHPTEGLVREVFEETGFKVDVEKIISTIHDPETARLEICCFGKFVNGTFKSSAEVSEFGFFEPDNLPVIGKKQRKVIIKTLKKEKIYSQKSWFNPLSRFFNR